MNVQRKYRHYMLHLKQSSYNIFDGIIIDFHTKDFCTALNIFSMQPEHFSLFSSAS